MLIYLHFLKNTSKKKSFDKFDKLHVLKNILRTVLVIVHQGCSKRYWLLYTMVAQNGIGYFAPWLLKTVLVTLYHGCSKQARAQTDIGRVICRKKGMPQKNIF